MMNFNGLQPFTTMADKKKLLLTGKEFKNTEDAFTVKLKFRVGKVASLQRDPQYPDDVIPLPDQSPYPGSRSSDNLKTTPSGTPRQETDGKKSQNKKGRRVSRNRSVGVQTPTQTPSETVTSNARKVHTLPAGYFPAKPTSTEEDLREAKDFLEKLNNKYIFPCEMPRNRSFSLEPYRKREKILLERLAAPELSQKSRRSVRTPSQAASVKRSNGNVLSTIGRVPSKSPASRSSRKSNKDCCGNTCCKHGGGCAVAKSVPTSRRSRSLRRPPRSRYEFTHSFTISDNGKVKAAPLPHAVSTKLFELNDNSVRSVRRSRRPPSTVTLCNDCRNIVRSLSRSGRRSNYGGIKHRPNSRRSTRRSTSSTTYRSTAGSSPTVEKEETESVGDDNWLSFGSPRAIESPRRSFVQGFGIPMARDFVVRRSESTYVKPTPTNTSPYHSPVRSHLELTQETQRSIIVSYASSDSSSASSSSESTDDGKDTPSFIEKRVDEMFQNLGKFLSDPKPPKYYKGNKRIQDSDLHDGNY